MKRCLLLPVLFVLLGTVGCTDVRIKRQASLLNVETKTAAVELENAKTDAEKVKVAKQFFKVAVPQTQVLEDYMFGREPSGPAPVAPTNSTP